MVRGGRYVYYGAYLFVVVVVAAAAAAVAVVVVADNGVAGGYDAVVVEASDLEVVVVADVDGVDPEDKIH